MPAEDAPKAPLDSELSASLALQIYPQSGLTPEQRLVEQEISDDVRRNLGGYIRRYEDLPESHNGTVVSSDIAKELFPQYRQDRTRFTRVVHNTSAALADAIFRYKLARPTTGKAAKNRIILVTGVPGGGKTTAYGHDPDRIDPDAYLIFESNISDPEVAVPRIDAILARGYKPVIVVVYAPPNICLGRVVNRAKEIGRVVDIDYLASIHMLLAKTMRELRAKYGDRVEIRVADNSVNGKGPVIYNGVGILNFLEYKGTVSELREGLKSQLDQLRMQGIISEELYNEIRGPL